MGRIVNKVDISLGSAISKRSRVPQRSNKHWTLVVLDKQPSTIPSFKTFQLEWRSRGSIEENGNVQNELNRGNTTIIFRPGFIFSSAHQSSSSISQSVMTINSRVKSLFFIMVYRKARSHYNFRITTTRLSPRMISPCQRKFPSSTTRCRFWKSHCLNGCHSPFVCSGLVQKSGNTNWSANGQKFQKWTKPTLTLWGKIAEYTKKHRVEV